MQGFFDTSKFTDKTVQVKGRSCASCGLYKYASTPKIEPYGHFKKKIMVINEMPNEKDDDMGVPWHGPRGNMVKRKFRELGIDLFEDCLTVHAVRCSPLNKKKEPRLPTHQEILCCNPKVFSDIKTYKPKLIILLGNIAITSVIGSRLESGTETFTKWRGWVIPDKELNAWICPTFNPSFVIKAQEEKNEVPLIWSQDLRRGLKKLNAPLPYPGDPNKDIIITDDIQSVLKEMASTKLFAFDIESTGIKPYNKEQHKIVCISFCAQEDKAYAIPFPTKTKHLSLLKEILENPNIGKIAANMKYEDTWMNIMCGITVRNWVFDTMQAAHILDNRPGVTGLKFQTYVNFGVLGYEDDVAPYLKSPNTNTPNRILELWNTPAGRQKLLLYNGLDSLFEFRLALKQSKEMGIKW